MVTVIFFQTISWELLKIKKHKEQINILKARSTHKKQAIRLLKTKHHTDDIITTKFHPTT